MAMPNDFAASQAPSYIIYRDVPAGELYDPTAPLAFFPPKDSDELFDALRAKYPHLKSHSERMRDATIEFLLEERQVDSMSATVSPAMPSLYDSMTDASPWQQSWPSASMTTLSSPEMTNFATPSFDDSPMPSKQSSESQTPAIDQMTSVFSLSTSEQPKQRVRRKMTEAEKVEYRKRRIVKACDKCSKRKRKCTHNQPEIEGLKTSNDKSAHKIIKPRGTATKSNQNFEVTNTLFDLQETDMSNLFTSDALTGGYEDFTLMFDDPTLDFSFDEFMPFDQQQSFAPADNFRQCTQQFNTDNATSTRSTNSWESRAPRNAAAVDSYPSMLQGDSELEWGHDMVIPHSPQVFDSRHTRRRCDLAHSQSGSAPLSSPQSPNAGQLDGLAEAATLTSASGILASSSRPSHAQDSQTQSFLSQMRSGEIRGSTCEEDPGRSVDDGASLQAHTSRAQRPEATRSLRSHESSMEANGLEAIRGRPATQLRYRLRDAGTNDPALMSELSSTSATSSRSSSGLNSTAALEGRPSIRGQDTNSARMSNRSDAKNARSLPTATPRSSMPSRSSPTQGENVSHGLAGTTQNATPSRAPANLLPQRTSVPSVLQARPSSLDDSMTLRSSEIFRLKNRIPASLDGTSPASLHARPTAGLSVQANGGTKQQLDVASNALRPAAGHQTHEAARASTTSADDKSKSTEASGMRRIFTESDTNRERDHHGRDLSSQPTARQSTFTQWLARSEHISLRNAFAITALVALCLLAFNLLHMSILALALCAPVLIGNSRQSKASSPILDLRSRAQMTIRKRLSSSSAFRTTLQRTVCV